VSYVLQKHWRTVISYFVSCLSFSEYEDWMHNMVFIIIDFTNLEKSQVYSHSLMLRGWMVLIYLHIFLNKIYFHMSLC
jgi:hypothetical protein